MNTSLIFWMHEESNQGRHLRYAQQLAEQEDPLAENILSEFGALGKNLAPEIDRKIFWEKQFLDNSYLSSNYRIQVETSDSNAVDSNVYFQPILTFGKNQTPIYKIFFPDQYELNFKLHTDFKKSVLPAGTL